jgi:hypothetical protein
MESESFEVDKKAEDTKSDLLKSIEMDTIENGIVIEENHFDGKNSESNEKLSDLNDDDYDILNKNGEFWHFERSFKAE